MALSNFLRLPRQLFTHFVDANAKVLNFFACGTVQCSPTLWTNTSGFLSLGRHFEKFCLAISLLFPTLVLCPLGGLAILCPNLDSMLVCEFDWLVCESSETWNGCEETSDLPKNFCSFSAAHVFLIRNLPDLSKCIFIFQEGLAGNTFPGPWQKLRTELVGLV